VITLKKTIDKQVEMLKGNVLEWIVLVLKVKAIQEEEEERDREEGCKGKTNQEE
jgi:hypothetical protein